MAERTSGTAVCPGSYDPVTLGHLDIITRASNVFDRVIVGVVDQPVRKQKTVFTAEERVAFIQAEVTQLGNVEVKSFHNLLVEFARENDARAIVKEAREEQTQLISDEEVGKPAERQADEIVEDARAREREIRLGAEDYADDILNTLEINLQKFTAAVQRGRDRLQGREEAEVS